MTENNIKPDDKKSRKLRLLLIVCIFPVITTVILYIFVLNKPKPEPEPKTSRPSKTIAAPPEFNRMGDLAFIKDNGEEIVIIEIEIMDSGEERQVGMMMREEMEERQGMLFIFGGEGGLSFWMKNTVLSLDMIFINSDNKIVTIHKNTVPYDKSNYQADAPAKYVVEVNAGFTDKFNIKAGDSIEWKRIENFGGR